LPDERQITTVDQLFDEMCAILGGRASEELTFGVVSTGALNDLERVTKMAYAMVSYYGMSDKLGNLSFFDSGGNSEYSFHKPYSEKTAEMIDNEVSALIAKAYERSLKILRENTEGLSELAKKLLETEVIFSEDLEKIFGKRPWVREEPHAENHEETSSAEEPSAVEKVSTGEVSEDNS